VPSSASRPSGRGRLALICVSAACLLLGATANFHLGVPAWLPLFALLALAAILGWGIFDLRSGVFARPMNSVQTTRPELALTFDDGPGGEQTRSILATLEARGHRGTFFVVGKNAERDPELLAEIARRGHGIENHTWFHSYLTPFANPKKLAAELLQTSALIEKSGAKKPRWLRPPVGILSPGIAKAAALAGLDLAGWSATARDGVAARTIEDALARLERGLHPGAILVLHDGLIPGRVPIAAALLPKLLDRLEAKNLKSVTLVELVG